MNLEKQAIEILQTFAGSEPYQLGYSGGKDSDVLRHLAIKSRVNHICVHNHTTVDVPETVRYIRSKKGVIIEYPKETMWQLIVRHKTPPTRKMRYCCEDLKEYSGIGKKVLTGVRKYESINRSENQGIVTFTKPNKEIKKYVDNDKEKNSKKIIKGQLNIYGTEENTNNENFRITNKGGVVVLNYDNSESHRMVENCYRTSKTLVNPMLEWDDEFLWWYIRHEEIVINPLYKGGCPGGCGRIGCIGCPMSGKGREEEFAKYPKYKEAYIRAFDRMLKYREQCGNKNIMGWKNGQGVFDWWMEDKNIDGQYSMDFDGLDLVGIKEKGVH
ncbi:phosphoadenosine phosphosulfate reductase domain-containing protein [Lachnospiraceae bacterium LCP25S3_G4]